MRRRSLVRVAIRGSFGLNLGSYFVLFDKWNLAAVRLVDFPAVILLVLRFQPVLKEFCAPVVYEAGFAFSDHAGPIFAPSLLRALLFLLCGSRTGGQCRAPAGLAAIVVATVTFAFLLLLAKASQLRRDPYARANLTTFSLALRTRIPSRFRAKRCLSD